MENLAAQETEPSPAPVGHNRPRKRPARIRHVCPECNTEFLGDPRAWFCSTEHKRAWHNRQLGRGAPLVTLAMAWRQGRHRKGSEVTKMAFADFCNELDRLIAEDREAGRMGALDLVGLRARRGMLSIRDVRNSAEHARRKASPSSPQ